MSPLHRQVPIEVNGQHVEVDQGLADLILALNDRGFETFASCEDQPDTPNMAWVAFRSTDCAKQFAAIVQGVLIEPSPEEIANADPGDPGLAGGIGVAFAHRAIGDALAKVEAL